VTPEALDGQSRALDWFTAERRSLLAAVDLAVRMRLDTHTWQLARAIAEFLTRQGHWPDQLAIERAALEAAARRADRPGQARAYRSLARAHLMMGQYEQARADFQAALDHSRRALERFPESDPDHHSSRAAALNAVGWYAARLGDHRQALDHCRRALALAQQIGYRHVQAAVWDSLGYTHRRLGDQQEAIACYRHALRLYREEGDRYNEADVLTHLADTRDATGDPGPARDAWRAAVAILDELGHPDADRVRRRLTSGVAAKPDSGDRAEPDRGDGGG
jgi:tetratricopeptide (TPR) repeat protein